MQTNPNIMSEEEANECLAEQEKGQSYPTPDMIAGELERQATGYPPSDEEIEQRLEQDEYDDDEDTHDDAPFDQSDYWAGTARDENGD